MYNEIYTKCESMIEDLELVRKSCLVGDTPQIKDVKHEKLLNSVNGSTNALNGVMDTIRAYFAEE